MSDPFVRPAPSADPSRATDPPSEPPRLDPPRPVAAPPRLRLVPIVDEPAPAAGSDPVPARNAGEAECRVIPFPTADRPSPPRPERRPRSSPWPVAPLLPAGVPVDATAEAWLTERAVAARAGDGAALEALFRALGPRIDAWVARSVARSRPTPRCDGRPWLADDLRQEAWFALATTLETWPGEGSFLPWLLAVLPARLTDRWRALLEPEPRWNPVPPPPADDSHAACEIDLLLAMLADRLADPHDRALLLGHLRDGQPLVRLVGAAGDSTHAVYRRWCRLRVWLQAELAPEREGGSSYP